MSHILVTGAGGFIGTHLVERLKDEDHWVRGVDLKYPQWSKSAADEFYISDLRNYDAALTAMKDIQWVFALAADMGGAGFVFTGENDADILMNNAFINLNTVEAALAWGVERYLFSSSACVYPEHLQQSGEVLLNENDAYPAGPDSEYGWEKLFAERVLSALEGEMNTRIARFHNVYGPRGSWNDGREKAPAAMCRKVAMAKLTGDPRVEIWGDGEQARSFMYIDDCIDGLLRLMESDHRKPLNLGSDRMVTINELVDIIADIAGVEVKKVYVPGPQGVRSRNSDNALCRRVLDWEPGTSLEAGLAETYKWIENQVMLHLEGAK